MAFPSSRSLESVYEKGTEVWTGAQSIGMSFEISKFFQIITT